MTELARQFPSATGLNLRALKQAGRELLLAQSSDWPFILRTGTSPDYARKRVKDHLLRFIALHEQLTTTRVDEAWLARIEGHGQYFPGHQLPLLGVEPILVGAYHPRNRGLIMEETFVGGALGVKSSAVVSASYGRFVNGACMPV